MEDKGYDDQFNDGLFKAGFHNSVRKRPHLWPSSVSEMRSYTSYDGQGKADPYDWDTAHSEYMTKRPYYTKQDDYTPGLPYYAQAQYYQPPGGCPMRGPGWHGPRGYAYYDPISRSWRWVDSSGRTR